MLFMEAILANDYIPLNQVKITKNLPDPLPNKEQVLIRVVSDSINPIDWKLLSGELKKIYKVSFPYTPGSDFAGIIIKKGESVKQFKKDDLVYGMAGFNRGGSGSFSELTLANPSFLYRIPENLSFTQAAAVPLAGLRAWHVLNDCFQIHSGQKLLIHGGAGGIGTFAIQIAKSLGAFVATTCSSRDLEYVKSIGADLSIDYKNEDFSTIISDYDAVFDIIGGDNLAKSYKVLKPGGMITSMLGGEISKLGKKHKVEFIKQKESATEESFKNLEKFLTNQIIKIQIDKNFSFKDISKALNHLKFGHPRGKVALTIMPDSFS